MNKPSLLGIGWRLSIIFAGLTLCHQARAVTFSVTPTAVSNTYGGTITLQVTGLTAGDTVVVQKFVDANTNGVIDGADIMIQQFSLTDGQATVIGGVTNFNVPGDTDGTAGQITAGLNLQNDFSQATVGKYLFKLSSPAGHFTSITNSFTVTNYPYGQQFSGNVVNNGTNVPNAVVILFQPSNGGGNNPVAAAVANNSGAYTVKAPPGAYTVGAFKSNYVGDLGAAASITLNAGATVTTNIVVTNATQSISGKIVDASNSSIGLAGLLIPLSSTNNLLMVAFSDTNGNFTARVVPNKWKVQANGQGLNTYGYLRPQNNLKVDTSTGSVSGVTLALPKATALFYGNITDGLGNPLAHVQFSSSDQSTYLYGDDSVYSDQNGNYFATALAGTWSINVSSDGNPGFTNYIFSGGTQTTLNAGQAFQYNFTAILATNHITGRVQDSNGISITNVQVFANANLNGTNYQTQANTDGGGNYSLNVPNGVWNVSVYCCCNNNSLDQVLGSGNYQCPNSQNAVINNN
ncbi:MAG TPA: carboxypeptidase-like regulatory domain-containing protein, partial [Verrucomicrobiae bacterium]|nr:carboxypeptidase-like regulatory domain-containing protein [Verrucomicrobiae bacterium]